MAVRGAEVAVAMAQCEPFATDTTIDNGAGQIPWAKTPIYLVGAADMEKFAARAHRLKIVEVYKNVPDRKPTC